MHRQTIESYDRGADRWRMTRRGDERRVEDALADAAAFRQAVGPGLILDLGCGVGSAFAGLGTPVVGVDASRSMLGLVDRSTGAPLVAGDIEALPIADGRVAGAFASFSFQHLPRDGFESALAEVLRVLRPGGLVELWMHSTTGDDGVRADDDMGVGRWFTYWSAADLAVELPRAGFEVLTIDERPRGGRRTLARRPG